MANEWIGVTVAGIAVIVPTLTIWVSRRNRVASANKESADADEIRARAYQTQVNASASLAAAWERLVKPLEARIDKLVIAHNDCEKRAEELGDRLAIVERNAGLR